MDVLDKDLTKYLEYNPETGIFKWKKSTNQAIKIGSIAGSYNHLGYCKIVIKDKGYMAHRLAWLFIYGYFPENFIDHINRNPKDNRIKNLREVTQQCNIRNIGLYKNNKSGVKGITFDKKLKKWKVQIGVSNMVKYLGTYKSFDNAVCARLAGEQCLDWSGCDSSSPAYKYFKKNIFNK